MALDGGHEEQLPHDEVMSKVDALLRRHRGAGLEADQQPGNEPEIPTLTELIEELPPSASMNGPKTGMLAAEDTVRGHPASESAEPAPDQDLLHRLRPEIERLISEALATRLPELMREQILPDMTRELGEGLNRLREAMQTRVQSVVRETIEQEVKRVLKALIKERTDR